MRIAKRIAIALIFIGVAVPSVREPFATVWKPAKLDRWRLNGDESRRSQLIEFHAVTPDHLQRRTYEAEGEKPKIYDIYLDEVMRKFNKVGEIGRRIDSWNFVVTETSKQGRLVCTYSVSPERAPEDRLLTISIVGTDLADGNPTNEFLIYQKAADQPASH